MERRNKKLGNLVKKFDCLYGSGNFDNTSEASARTWVEELLKIFDWDVSNPAEVDQESKIPQKATEKMSEIGSNHKIPDYTFLSGDTVRAYLDVKKIDIDISKSKESAFQIRSYGWSSGTPCCFITNFREMAIFDSSYKPEKGDAADKGRAFYFKYNDYIKNFEMLEKHLLRDNVQSGKLRTYYQNEQKKGSKSLDEDFSELLSNWRLKFANEIYKSGQRDICKVQSNVQKILDRILFLRIAEGKNIEVFGTLKETAKKKNIHKKIISLCKGRLDHKYDGYLFGKNIKEEDMYIDDKLLKDFIECLYFPFPYKFEVIPAEIFGNMYEQYLGKRLVLGQEGLVDEFKPEYQKSQGAVYTPKHIVDAICFNTIESISSFKSIDSILKLNVLDMSCGSGSFLLGIFDYMESKIKSVVKSKHIANGQYRDWFWINPKNNQCYLTATAKRKIIVSCIYGIDIDPQAVEIAKLSLALKVIEGSESNPSEILGLKFSTPKILDSIDKNIKNGNSLVDRVVFDIFPKLIDDHESIEELKIFDWDDTQNFKNVMVDHGGFDAIVGNPPYIETKHYKNESPWLHKLLTLTSEDSIYKTASGGKVDVAMPFIERGISKLNKNGRLGYIVQNRFFKTDYGKATRKYLCENTYLDSIMDFGEAKIFKGRNTYTAIMTFSKSKKEKIYYKKIDCLENSILDLGGCFQNMSDWHSFQYHSIKDGNPWNFSNPELLKLLESLGNRHPYIKQQENIHLKVGLQVTWDKVYHLKKAKESGKYITGTNGFGDTIKVEKDSCRPIVCNEKLYSFAKLSANVYSLFPYDVIETKNGRKAQEILFSDFKKRFPLAGKYLLNRKKDILSAVTTLPNDEQWHLYTRKQNLASQCQPKIIIPTTVPYSIAIVDEKGDFYQDNVRVFSMILNNPNKSIYWAIASILNSSLIANLSLVVSPPQQNKYIHFNKQFIEPLPLPIKIFTDQTLSKKIASIGQDIFSMQEKYLTTKRLLGSIEKSIEEKWRVLDRMVEDELYELKPPEKKILTSSSRSLNRFQYFLSQTRSGR